MSGTPVEARKFVEGVGGRLASSKSQTYANGVLAIEGRNNPFIAKYMLAGGLACVLSAHELGVTPTADAKALMEPLPLSPRGQPVPGFPEGPPASPPDVLKFTDADIAKLKEGKFTAGLVMHTTDAGWPALQVAGITGAGNLKDMFLNMTPANDLRFKGSTNAPTLRIEGMTIASS